MDNYLNYVDCFLCKNRHKNHQLLVYPNTFILSIARQMATFNRTQIK